LKEIARTRVFCTVRIRKTQGLTSQRKIQRIVEIDCARKKETEREKKRLGEKESVLCCVRV